MKKIKLGNVLDVKRGTSLSGKYYAEEGTLIRLTLGNFNYPNGGFKSNSSKSDIYYNGPVRKEFVLKKGDIITPLTEQVSGLLGETATIPEDNTYIQCGDIGLVIPDETKLAKRYAYYLISSPVVKRQLDAAAQQTKIRHTSPDAIKACEAWIPDELSKQEKIAKFLDDINEAISNNSSICSDLESMAKLFYDYWFVQFDFPDENGKPYKSSGGKMVWNEELKREIPEGWEVVSLQDCINSDKNGDWGNKTPKKCDDLKVKCFRGADFASITSNYQTTAPVRYISKKNSDKLLSEGDLVVEISGGSPTQATGRIGYINAKFLERCGGIMVCSNFCKAFTPKKKTQQYWLYQTWKMYYDAGLMFNFEGKTTGIKNLLFESFVKDIKMPLPPETLLLKYQMIVSVYYDKIQECFMESSSLAELRDFLLPMLMNGQVKVG